MTVWKEMKRVDPLLFNRAVDVERMVNEKRRRNGQTPIWLTRHAKPLDEAVNDKQQELEFEGWDVCESGHCMT